MKVSNKNASYAVNNLLEFQGSNTFAEFKSGVYKVYSYGYHFPIYANKSGQWFKNVDKYSVSTSKHQSQLKPNSSNFILLNTQDIISL
jgi:hypothetical protein